MSYPFKLLTIWAYPGP